MCCSTHSRQPDALGGAHDRDVLLRRLVEVASDGEGTQSEVYAVQEVIRAETLACHAKYMAWRPDVLAICEACERATPRRTTARALLVAGVGVPSLLLLRRRGREQLHGRAAKRPRQDVVDRSTPSATDRAITV